MEPEITLRTDRLQLVATTLQHICAELSDPNALATLLSAHVPDSWPPGEYDRDALEFFRSKLAEAPNAVGWYGWYVISLGADGSRKSVVAGAGYLGPPSPDGGPPAGDTQPSLADTGAVPAAWCAAPERRNT